MQEIQRTWVKGFPSPDLLIIWELIDEVITIDPFCLLSDHSLQETYVRVYG